MSPKTRFTRLFPLTLAAAAIAIITPAARAFVLTDPELAIGKDAIDPTEGESAGTVNITKVASGSPSKEALLAVPGMRVLRSFTGFVGAVEDPINRVRFSDKSLPELTFFTGSATGYSGCHSMGAYTSGRVENEHPGESIYLGDAVSELAYSIDFSKPVAAAAFTMARLKGKGGKDPVWIATFYAPGQRILAQQTVSPGSGENVAALFGHIATAGEMIERIVIGKAFPDTAFVMGAGQVYLDDVAFAPFVPSKLMAGSAK